MIICRLQEHSVVFSTFLTTIKYKYFSPTSRAINIIIKKNLKRVNFSLTLVIHSDFFYLILWLCFFSIVSFYDPNVSRIVTKYQNWNKRDQRVKKEEKECQLLLLFRLLLFGPSMFQNFNYGTKHCFFTFQYLFWERKERTTILSYFSLLLRK